MRQLIQSYKSGELALFDVPIPQLQQGGALVRTTASLVSAGTEKMIVDIAKKSIVGKAKARPDLVKQVVRKMQQEGIQTTLQKVFSKLDTPIPLGYSAAGTVIALGSKVIGVRPGDRVACGGAGYANHSEVNYVPQNLFVRIPDGVDDVDASFVTVGAIALQGVRQAMPTLGERVAVLGLGLIGQLTVQLLKANGCKVLGSDISPDRIALAKTLGADTTCASGDLREAADAFSAGCGLDAVIITASTSSNEPIDIAGEILRAKGRVVVVGQVGMNIPRNTYYRKELDLRLSMAYGPGRYDPRYEEEGIDYPLPYVRWTEQRNFEAFLGLVAEGRVTPKALLTHSFSFDDALKAYDLLSGKTSEPYLGIVLTYPNTCALQATIPLTAKPLKKSSITLGCIGAGNFAKGVLLPAFKDAKGFEFGALITATGISAHTTGKKYGFRASGTDADKLFSNGQIDAVVITSRHNDHAEYVIKSLRAGKHVFVEKPLCLSYDELEQISHAVAAAGGDATLMVGFNRRFSRLIGELKDYLPPTPLVMRYRVNAGPIPLDHWIHDKEIGGGRILGEVCHFVDTLSAIAKSTVTTVHALQIGNSTDLPLEDNIVVNLQFASGSVASLTYTAVGNKQLPKEHIEIFGHDIAATLDDFRELNVFKGSKKIHHKLAAQDKGFSLEIEAFKESIKSGVPAVPFASLANTTKTCLAILDSLHTHQIITVD